MKKKLGNEILAVVLKIEKRQEFRVWHTEFVYSGHNAVMGHNLGCSGTHHAINKTELYYGGTRRMEDGRALPTMGKNISTRVIGVCDGTCGPRNLGGFLA